MNGFCIDVATADDVFLGFLTIDEYVSRYSYLQPGQFLRCYVYVRTVAGPAEIPVDPFRLEDLMDHYKGTMKWIPETPGKIRLLLSRKRPIRSGERPTGATCADGRRVYWKV